MQFFLRRIIFYYTPRLCNALMKILINQSKNRRFVDIILKVMTYESSNDFMINE